MNKIDRGCKAKSRLKEPRISDKVKSSDYGIMELMLKILTNACKFMFVGHFCLINEPQFNVRLSLLDQF